MEIWVDIKNYEGFYQISNLGRIRGIDRHVNGNYNSKASIKGKILKLNFSKGYFRINLNKNKVKWWGTVHRLVALHFISNPLNLPYINHIDGNTYNNCVENLEWCTPKQNTKHAWKIGLCTSFKGEQFKNAKLTEDKVIQIRKLRSLGESWSNITKLYGVSKTTASDACKGKTWKHVIYPPFIGLNKEQFLKSVKKEKIENYGKINKSSFCLL